MNVVARLYQPSIGKKAVMAVTGVILFGFTLVHMIGNLQIYLGPEKLNAYGAFLKSSAAVLWGARIFLLACVLAHVGSAVLLTLQRRAARPTPYAKVTPQASTYASRTMMISGPILAAFIIYHLLHYTTGQLFPGPNFSHTDVYRNVIIGFSNPAASAFYIVAMLCLGFHLIHGVKSFFQSLGLATVTRQRVRQFALAVVTLLVLGNLSMPIAVLAGLLK